MADTLDSTTLSLDEHGTGDSSKQTSPALFLLIESDRPLAGSARYVLGGVDEIQIGRGRDRILSRTPDKLRLDVPDRRMSTRHARLHKVHGAWLVTDLGSKNGVRINGVDTKKATLHDGDIVELGHSLFRFRGALPVSAGTKNLDASELPEQVEGMASLVPALQTQMDQLARVAVQNVSIILAGESGTGKEVVARAVHAVSGRKGRFVPVNCGALPDNLVESELFGHRKGAFSGAVADRPGYVRSADGGTLLLDEIADLPLMSQTALLRVLQEGEVVPVGDTEPVAVDLRVVSATHKNLEELVAREEFRADLFARLSGLQFVLPPLRERVEDIGWLIARLLARLDPGRADRVTLTPAAARALFAYDWPLNVRELEKALSVALAVAEDDRIGVDDLPDFVAAAGDAASASAKREVDAPLSEEDEARKQELIRLLDEHNGNVSAVARAMGKARMQVHRWAKRYGIDLAVYKD